MLAGTEIGPPAAGRAAGFGPRAFPHRSDAGADDAGGAAISALCASAGAAPCPAPHAAAGASTETPPAVSATAGHAALVPSRLIRAVAVFGSSRCAEGSPDYREAYALGQALARAGLVVVNGGYGGVMAAAARGAKDAGGRTVGITVAVFPDRAPNAWLDEVIHTPTLFARLEAFTRRADAFVVLRGGIGTLLEFALVWNMAQTGALGAKPVVLLGQHWPSLLRALRRYTTISDEDLALFLRAHTPEEVVGLVRRPAAEAGGRSAATAREPEAEGPPRRPDQSA